MICKFCNHEIPDDSDFCPKCGNKIAYEAFAVDTDTSGKNESDEKYHASLWAMIWGFICIASLNYAPAAGIILSCIARSKINASILKFGDLGPKGKTGSILTKVALIMGIVQTALILTFVFLYFAGLITAIIFLCTK